jgi:hypothetical protein
MMVDAQTGREPLGAVNETQIRLLARGPRSRDSSHNYNAFALTDID